MPASAECQGNCRLPISDCRLGGRYFAAFAFSAVKIGNRQSELGNAYAATSTRCSAATLTPSSSPSLAIRSRRSSSAPDSSFCATT